jgi:ABC-type nickel/cobalt efflux system permease component RcnA
MTARDFSLPETPNPSTITQVASVIRTILAGLAGMGIGTGLVVNDAQLTAISAMVLTIGSLAMWAAVGAWSLWQKYKSAKADHAGSVASAQASANATQAAGTPVAVVVPPP